MTFSHASSDLPRRTIGGFQVLLSPDGPYLEVAERVRAAHRCGTLSVERGEILTIQPWHLYRVSLSLDACTYIGDVDLPHQGKQAPPTSIFDAQTAAVGQALARRAGTPQSSSR